MNYAWTLVVVCDAHYVLPTAVCLRSADAHFRRPPVAVYVLGEGMTADDAAFLRRQVRNAPVHFLAVESPLTSYAVHADAAHVSAAMFLKCVAPSLVADDAERLVYLDSDTLVRADLADLADTDLDGNTAGLVLDRYVTSNAIDPGNHPYFNSGVILVDVEKWNKLSMTETILSEITERADDLRYPDQDALNKALRGSVEPLDKRWNYMVGETVKNNPDAPVDMNGDRPSVLHFCGPTKPWHLSLPHVLLQTEYDKYLTMAAL